MVVRTASHGSSPPATSACRTKTAAAWRNGWFHTGDGFRCDEDGNYYFVDRIKDAIRRRGENISSFEVEAAVNEHPAVQESAAVGGALRAERGRGQGRRGPRAGRRRLTPEELITFLVPRMPRFMMPRYVEVVDELAKTDSTQRTQKFALARQRPQ